MPKLDETLAESAVIATPAGTQLPTMTPSPVAETPLAEEACTEMVCRPVKPDGYLKITLPLSDFALPDAISEGDWVDLLRIGSTHYGAKIESVMLMTMDDETLTIAAPAWKYRLLQWFSESGAASSYEMTPADGPDTTISEPMEPTTYKLITPDTVPEHFNLVVTMPETEIHRLADLPYDGIHSSLDTGVLHFIFPDLEMVGANADASYIIRLRTGEAANLDYLLSLGAEIDIYWTMPKGGMPLPTATEEAK